MIVIEELLNSPSESLSGISVQKPCRNMPKIVDHEQYRQELLSKCFDLFAEKGYAAITMRQLAQGLGVSTGTLYHYFPSKEALFEQLVREMTLHEVQRFLAEAKKFKTLVEQIEAIFDFVEQHEDYYIKQTLLWVEFYQYQSRAGSDRTGIFSETWNENEKIIMDVIGIQDKTLINLVGCFIDGMLLHRMFECRQSSFDNEKKMLLQMLKLYTENAKSCEKRRLSDSESEQILKTQSAPDC